MLQKQASRNLQLLRRIRDFEIQRRAAECDVQANEAEAGKPKDVLLGTRPRNDRMHQAAIKRRMNKKLKLKIRKTHASLT